MPAARVHGMPVQKFVDKTSWEHAQAISAACEAERSKRLGNTPPFWYIFKGKPLSVSLKMINIRKRILKKRVNRWLSTYYSIGF